MATDRRAEQRERTRQQILVAAWDLAEEQGIAGLSLRDLAAAVGMRAPSLYTYFDSKSAIHDAMFVEGYEQMDRMFAGLALDPDDPAASLGEALEAFVRFCQASRPRYQLMFTHVVPDWSPSASAYARSVASYRLMTERMATLGIAGEDALDLWTAVSAGLAAQQVANDPAGDRWLRLAPQVASMFLHHLERS